MKEFSLVRLGLVQMKSEPGPSGNLKKVLIQIEEAARRKIQILCLQELFLFPYFPRTQNPEHFRLAETVPGPTTEMLAEVSRKHRMVVVAPLFEKSEEGIYYNTAVIFDEQGKLLGKYRKVHLPHDPGFYEKFYFSPGDLGFKSFETSYGKIGVLICWDQWFPEAARLSALSGAQIIFYPSAIGWVDDDPDPAARQSQRDAWETIQRGHAIANGVFVASVNRVGREGEIQFWGSSFVSDPLGGVLGRAGAETEELLTVDCDLKKIKETRENWPFLEHRCPKTYGHSV